MSNLFINTIIMKKKLLFLALSVFTLSVFSQTTPAGNGLSSLTINEDKKNSIEVELFNSTDLDAVALDNIEEDITTTITTVSSVNTDATRSDAGADIVQKAKRTVNVSNNQLVTLVTSNTSIVEGETFTVTASVDTATTADIIVNLTSVGAAKYSTDFTSNAATRISTVAGGNGYGSDQNQLAEPQSVFVDNAGSIYVADRNNGRIQKFAPGSTEGELLITGLSEPINVFVDNVGSIYVLEHSAHKVSKWAADGSFIDIVAGLDGYGSNSNQLYYPEGLFVDIAGNIYIGDRENQRIQKWLPNANEGITVAGGNGNGWDLNQFSCISNIFVDDLDSLYVADRCLGRVTKWVSGAIQGEILFEELDAPRGVFLDNAGSIFVLESNQSQVKKYNPGMSSGVVVAGGNGSGSNANQFNESIGLFVDEMGTIYIADSRNNRVQKYDSSPQLIILAGDTEASLTFSAITDTKDENTEAITLNTTIIGEGSLSTDEITVNITDINNPPTVVFTFSEDRIIENSNTDVTLIATLSDVSGKEITIDFTMGGTAVEGTDYNISTNTITIPIGSLSGIITVSTAEIPADDLVEGLDSIIFNVTTITNATQVEDTATLFLDSIEEPNLTLSVSKESIAENETFKITATLDAATSKDVVINFESAETATAAYNTDYTSASETRIKTIVGGSSGNNSNQLSGPGGVFVDNSGNLYVADSNNGRIQKFVPGATEGQTLISGLNYPVDVFVENTSGSIYVVEQNDHKVTKWDADGSGGTIVAGGAGNGSNANQLWNPRALFVDAIGNIYIVDSENKRIQKWAPLAIAGVTVAGGNGQGWEQNKFEQPSGIFVDGLDNIYVTDEWAGRVQKWIPEAIQGETVINGLNSPYDISIDASGSIYVLERQEHKVTKYLAGSSSGAVVAGGEGRGSSNNQLNYPRGLFIDEIGNIYIADSDNHRVQKYDISPQLVITAGETEAVLLFSGKRDTTDEVDETIILNTTVSNAIIASTDALTINLTDINEEPTVALTFSKENITENSSTDVTLTATLSEISGKEVNIIFVMEGTAAEDADYSLSSKTITIPANSSSGTIMVSTEEIPADGIVEVLASIVFRVNEITNATAVAETATLFLESIENPNLTLTVSQESIAENETFNVIATLDAAASKDVVVNFESLGIAIYNSDYTSNSETRISTIAGGNGYGNAQNQLQNPRGIFVDQAENIFVTNADRGIIQKFAPGVTDGETLIENLNGPINISVDAEGNIYVLEQYAHKVTKWVADGSSSEVVAGGNDQGNNSNQLNYPQGLFVDLAGNVFIADSNNHRIQKWTPGATEGITVAGGNEEGNNQNQTSNPRGIFVDKLDNLFVVDQQNRRIQKWAVGAIQGETVIKNLNNPTGVSVDISGSIYVLEETDHTVTKYAPGSSTGVIVAGALGQQGGNANQLNYPQNLFVDAIGNIYVLDSNNQRIQKYENSPQLVVKAGETEAELLFSGIEDTKDEEDETIILNTSVSNAVLVNTEAVRVNLTDTTEEPTVIFSFNEDKITETSSTDVILTATLSAVSGKEVKVVFTMEGTAELLVDYKLSSQTITIPANSPTGTIIISTKEIPADDEVEILDTIVFKVASIENATSETESATLLLESNESPSVVLSVSKETIAEHETFNIIATLDAATSKDVVVGLESIGTALYDTDFKRNAVLEIKTVAGGNGYGSAKNQIASPRGLFITADGSLYVADEANGRIQKWAPGAKEGQTIVNDLNSPRDVFVDLSGNIYSVGGDGRAVIKTPFGTTNKEVVAGTYSEPGQASDKLANAQSIFVDLEGNVFIADRSNNRIQKWEPGATEGETVATGSIQVQGAEDSDLTGPYAITMDLEGNLLIIDDERRVIKWVPGEDTGETIISYNEANNYYNTYPIDIEVDSEGNIFVLTESYDYNLNQQQFSILKHDNISYEAIIVVGGNGTGSEPNQLNEARNFTFDALGNIYISDEGNKRVQKYEFSLQVKVKAGDTSGALVIAGIEDELNEEGTELIVIRKTLASNAILNDTDELSITLLDNTKTMVLKDSPFLGLSEGAVSWGDYDKDGDKDVAIMGKSGSLGAVTKLYENNNGVFEDTQQNLINLFGGDITWVDLNKDGYIDLVVSGYDGVAKIPVTKVYINEVSVDENIFIEQIEGYQLPQLFSTKMAWGDLDNDGDIDLAIAGQDADDSFIFEVYYKDDATDNYIKDADFSGNPNEWWNESNVGFINGDLKIVDIDLDGDNDIIYNGENSNGDPVGKTIYNTYIRVKNYENNIRLKNSAIEVAKLTAESNNISIISSGQNSEGNIVLSVSNNYGINSSIFPKLKNGDISVADYNNDGRNDILFTGENEFGEPITKLFKQASVPSDQNATETYFKDSGIVLKGLRASTANWVDYDMDGDLDLFLTGVGDAGAETLLYETEIANKKNTAPEKITGLELVDLGNGNVRFNWDLPADDYATNLGYVLRLGITPGGTELSNTESDLVTGERLISKAPPIYNNFYDMQLDPGNYYWSVQAVDPGLKGGIFSEEDAFTLVYEWKILNQGGIVDRTVSGVSDPVIKLADVDNDNDLDVIYSSKTGGNTQLLKYDGTQLIKDNQSPLQYVSNVTNSEVADINGDGIADILVNTADGSNYQLKIYLSNGEDVTTDDDPANGIYANSGYNEQNIGQGLYNAKARIVDLNNDGQAEIFLAGMSSSSINGVPKLYLYEYTDTVMVDEYGNPSGNPSFTLNDVSSQIATLQNASYDLGDVDNDQDIDFIISGWDFGSGHQSYIYENITELGGEFTLKETSNNLVAVQNGTTNFIDFDGDGDLDAVFTGESEGGDVFEIYMNTLNEGIAIFSRLPNDLAPMREGKIDLGDFNGDGYADLLYSGTFPGAGDVTKLSEYNPTTKSYVDSAFDVSDIIKAEVEFGDLDGDGDLDFVIAGKSNETDNYGNISSANIFRTYINVRNQSAAVLESSTENKRPQYKGKNAAKYVQNETFTANNPPSAPILKDVKFLSETEGSADIPVEFEWGAATDDHTPGIGLTYAIKIGLTPGGEEIMSSNSNTNGIKKDAEKGNVEHNLKWKLSLPEGTYYYSVQAVDASYSGSVFTEAVQFKVTASGIDSDTDSDGIENSEDLCPNTPKGAAVDNNGCEVIAILGDANGNTEVASSDLVVAVNYILGNNPIPFVFKAADVNNDQKVDVRDIVGIADLVLNAALSKNKGTSKATPYYSNIPIGDALFSWEGNDLYVSTDKEIAGMQLVFDKDFTYELSNNLANFNIQNFKKGSVNTLIIYSFSEVSIKSGKTKLLTKYEEDAVILDVKKSSTGALKGLTLTVAFKPNALNQLEPFILGPNPSSGEMNLFYNVPKETDVLLLKVYNVNGSKVWSSNKIKNIEGSQQTTLDLSFLSDGIYFMRIEEYSKGALQQNEVKRLIINK